MADEIIQNTRMQQRRGTNLEWNTLDPVLLEGEIGVNLTNNTIKIGDGVKKWSQLSTIGFELPPNDNKYYAMKNGQWAEITIS